MELSQQPISCQVLAFSPCNNTTTCVTLNFPLCQHKLANYFALVMETNHRTNFSIHNANTMQHSYSMFGQCKINFSQDSVFVIKCNIVFCLMTSQTQSTNLPQTDQTRQTKTHYDHQISLFTLLYHCK